MGGAIPPPPLRDPIENPLAAGAWWLERDSSGRREEAAFAVRDSLERCSSRRSRRSLRTGDGLRLHDVDDDDDDVVGDFERDLDRLRSRRSL